MSQTSRFDKEKVISVPRHLAKYREEASPYGKRRENKLAPSRILLSKKTKSGLMRGQTMFSNCPDEGIVSLINVERNFVRDLIKSPLKVNTLKIPDAVASAGKKKLIKSKFESLTICDFIAAGGKKKPGERRRSKCSVTPDVLNKRK